MVVFIGDNFPEDLAERSILTLIRALGKYKTNGIELLKENGIGDLKLNKSYNLQNYFSILKKYNSNLTVIY